MNHQYRSSLTHVSIQPGDISGLANSFGTVLVDAGATTQEATTFESDMDQLLAIDSQAADPSVVATNDYSLILQTALAVGRPIVAPTRPTIEQSDNTGSKHDYITTVAQPHLTGSYAFSEGTTINIVDNVTGGVVGSELLPSSGSYTVQFTNPLSVGRHTFRMQAVDSNGDYSVLSKPFTLTIQAVRTRPIRVVE